MINSFKTGKVTTLLILDSYIFVIFVLKLIKKQTQTEKSERTQSLIDFLIDYQ